MTIDDFTARRRPGWYELEGAINRANSGVGGMTSSDLERFGVLYRHAAGDLAIANRDFPTDNVAVYLNSLCSRAHTMLYLGRGGMRLVLAQIADFYRSGLPRIFRASWGYMLAALALLLLGVVAGWLAVVLRPDLAPSLVPNSLFDQMARGQIGTQPSDPAITTFGISANNIKVAAILFASGFLLGLPTALLLMANGWMLGTLAAAIHQGGFDLAFWSLILPHGVMELSITVFAGGAGLMLGDSIMRPHLLSRPDSVYVAAVRAMGIALGVAALLPICGFIEAFVSPSALPQGVKIGVGVVTGAVLYSWLLLAGRTPRPLPEGPVLGDSWQWRPDSPSATG